MRRILTYTALGGLCLGLWSCSGGPGDIAGAGSKTPNAVIQGQVTYSNGSGLSKEGAMVLLYSISGNEAEGYNWDRLATTTSDSAGDFTFDSLEAGNYSLVVEKDDYKGFSGYLELAEEDSIKDIDSVVLQSTLTIIGIFKYVPWDIAFISMVGTGFSDVDDTMYTSERRHFVFDRMPVADFRMEITLEPGTPKEKEYYLPLPGSRDLSIDTVYSDTAYHTQHIIQIKDGNMRIESEDFIINFLIWEDIPGTTPKTASSANSDYVIFVKETEKLWSN